MKIALTLIAGAALWAIASRVPAMLAPILHDWPATPSDWKPRHRYWNGGVEVEKKEGEHA